MPAHPRCMKCGCFPRVVLHFAGSQKLRQNAWHVRTIRTCATICYRLYTRTDRTRLICDSARFYVCSFLIARQQTLPRLMARLVAQSKQFTESHGRW
eukprot:7321587-Heterocapsa_arctica.AAC.1